MSAGPVVDLRASGAFEAWRQWFEEVEPRVHAFVDEPNRWARVNDEIARAAGPLAGVSVAVKDVFHVDGLPTRAGSALPPEELAGAEAASVTRLRRAGAVIAGKANTTEFAYFAPGPTRNPHDLEHTPGGSSSGSAAAVATGQAMLALGTQTIGSVGRPASFCGVVGYKPSRERIPRDGLIPLAPSFDHVGVFGPSVAWVERAAAVLCDDWKSGASAPSGALAIPTGPLLEAADPPGREHFAAVCARLRAAGWELLEAPALGDFARVVERHRRVVAAEAARVHRPWASRFRALYRRPTLELIDRGETITDAELEALLEECGELRGQLETARQRAGAIAWLCPAAKGPAPRGLESTGDPVMNLPWTQSGLPAIVVPAGFVGHLPVGVQIVGEWWGDEALLALATQLAAAVDPADHDPNEASGQ